MVIKLFGAVLGFAGQVDSKLFECLHVSLRKNYRGVCFAAPKHGEAGECFGGVLVVRSGNRKGKQGFVKVKPCVVVPKVGLFKLLYRYNDHRVNQLYPIVDSGDGFKRVKQRRGGGTQK